MADPKKIKFTRHTRNYRKGQVVAYDPTLEWYIAAGAAEPVGAAKSTAAKGTKKSATLDDG